VFHKLQHKIHTVRAKNSDSIMVDNISTVTFFNLQQTFKKNSYLNLSLIIERLINNNDV